MLGIQNPFTVGSVAERYDKGRPFFHPEIVKKIGQKLNLHKKLGRALDVGCGTGLSSKALLEISQSIVGIDSSASMLSHAHEDSRIIYRQMRAEEIDFPNRHFDLITVSQVLHWLDQSEFFEEAARVMKPGAHLVIYDNFFLWGAKDGDAFAGWFENKYLEKFPRPIRGKLDLSEEGNLEPNGFTFAGCEECVTPRRMSKSQLIDYLVTQSNVAAACDLTGISVSEARNWLEEELALFFVSSSDVEFNFGGPVYYLQRQ